MGDLCIIASRRQGVANVVGSGEQDDNFGIHSIEFAVVQAPKNVFGLIRTPTKIGGVPAEEVLFPVSKQLRIISRSPAARDGIAFKINVDAAFLCFFE